MNRDSIYANADVLANARNGDARAFADLIRMHQRGVYSMALRMTNDRGLAEDLAQDVFLELHRNLHAIESDEHLTFWLRRVTTHRAIDRARRHRLELVDLDARDEIPATPDGDDVLWQRHIHKLIAELQPDARAVLLLRYQEDLDPTDIARSLEMPVNTVKSHLKRSLAILRGKVLGADSAQEAAL
jgi:RNA polymerase sigma-70 factor (ECF subfamily)